MVRSPHRRLVPHDVILRVLPDLPHGEPTDVCAENPNRVWLVGPPRSRMCDSPDRKKRETPHRGIVGFDVQDCAGAYGWLLTQSSS